MDMDRNTIKAVWGFNGTERPGAVYLAAVLAGHAQKGLPAFGIYGHEVQDMTDTSIPDDVSESKLEFYGTKGCIIAKGTLSQVEGGNVEVLRIEDAGQYNAQQNRTTVTPVNIEVTFGNMYTKEIEAFSDSIINNTDVPVSAEDAILSQKVERKPVHLFCIRIHRASRR
jgi:predicted dehydrogenase